MHLNDLLHCDDEQFVLNCYRLVIGREPDGEGFAYYLTALRNGRSRIRVVKDFLRSREGKMRGEQVIGVQSAAIWRVLSKVSLIGALTQRIAWSRETTSLARRLKILEDVSAQMLYLAAEDAAKQNANYARPSVELDEMASSLSPRAIDIFIELRG